MGRVQVEPDLSLAGHPEIFVIGDLAAFEQDGKPLPGVAPVAMQQGRFVAQELRRRLRGDPARVFHYVNKGSLATIGRAAAVADFGFARFSGWVAWLLWLFIHLLYLVGFQSRLVVLIQWAFQYLTFNRGARLITGENPDLPAMAPLPGERLKPYAADRSETSGSGRC
jgi:NADH dehydrogenase